MGLKLLANHQALFAIVKYYLQIINNKCSLLRGSKNTDYLLLTFPYGLLTFSPEVEVLEIIFSTSYRRIYENFNPNYIYCNLTITSSNTPQIDNKYELDPYRLLQERVNFITKPNEQIKQRLPTDNFSNSESRTIINKKILDNGFLLIEEKRQLWYGSNWVDTMKITYC